MRIPAWLARVIVSSSIATPRIRRAALIAGGSSVGRSKIMHELTIGGSFSGLSIGDGVFINTGCSLHPTGGINIGNDVSFGPRVIVMTGTHEIGGVTKRASNPTHFRSVSIESGAWLGAGVIVNPGITVGAGCVVAPGAVITRDCLPNGLYMGIPARRTRDLPVG